LGASARAIAAHAMSAATTAAHTRIPCPIHPSGCRRMRNLRGPLRRIFDPGAGGLVRLGPLCFRVRVSLKKQSPPSFNLPREASIARTHRRCRNGRKMHQTMLNACWKLRSASLRLATSEQISARSILDKEIH
jgi:hypothetical protein